MIPFPARSLALAACLLAVPAGTANADTQALATELNGRIARCWNVPADLPPHVEVVRVRFALTTSGELAGSPVIDGATGGDKASKAFAASAIRAILRCAPYPGLEAFAPHEAWKTVIITFRRPDQL